MSSNFFGKLRSQFFRFFQYQKYKRFFYQISHFADGLFLITLIASLGVTGLLIVTRNLGHLQVLELAAFDHMMRFHSDKEVDPRLLLVTITEEDIQRYKQIPLSDGIVAQILEKLQEYNPKVIGLDLYRDIPYYPGTSDLEKQLQNDNIIAIRTLDHLNGVPAPPNIPKERIGFNDIVLDYDNVVRRNFMYTEFDGEKHYSFALRLSLKYLSDKNLSFTTNYEGLLIGNAEFLALNFNSGNYEMKKSESVGWQILLDYHSPQNIAREITITQLLEGNFNPSWINEKIVLIGTTAPSEKDLFLTPYLGIVNNNYSMSGVMIHAQMVRQILNIVLDEKKPFWFWTQWQEYIWILLWAVIGSILSWHFHRILKLVIYEILTIIILYGLSLFLFIQGGWIPLIPPLLGMMGTTLFVLNYKLFYSNFHDGLTGLPNREFLSKKIYKINKKLIDKEDSIIVILCIGIDRLKMINETLGYKVGDLFLLKIVERLKSCLTPFDILARLGGNEFAILISSCSDINNVDILANKIEQKLIKPFNLNGQEIFITVNIGIAFNKAIDKLIPDELIRNAHTAMNRAKVSSIGKPQIFVTGMYTQAMSRLKLETDIRAAIKKEEFELYYQPIINLKTEKLSGFEALVRWNSPTRGFVSPADFIPISEETDLIIPLGKWILNEACTQMNQWHSQFPDFKNLMISVNLSSRQFVQSDLVKMIKEIILKTNINPKTVKLEITESMVMKNVNEAIGLLSELKALEVLLSIDDFGTGYSSLSYLHHFPLDVLKIDQSFVKTIDEYGDGGEIAQTIIMLGKNLGMDLIAEGIETEMQKDVIKNLDCQYGQGYFFCKPLPKDDITQMLKNFY